MNTDIQQLLDRNEITDLVYRLGVCLDDGRFDEMGTLLVDDATVQTPGGTAEGRAALVAQAERNHRPEDRVQHITTNLLIDLDGDRADVRANLLVHFAPVPDADAPLPALPVRLTLGEIYRFEAVRTGEGWRFGRVEASPVWMAGTPAPRPQPEE